ncbi:phosphatase PAP2 family protein [Streptomyces nitrosporeus]|uniref:phosphatase PAP2 family protein n=1 Tax=Streptomyces nitrosporeus TaxID=28894 RepID=UPI001994E14B|nr:phosphatase PAP2 family protein [Streptomyces nitrosporeus]GGZ21886.1 hypothetical protein GCM10010327_61070 [Streptomyces nitrosporeus]
MTMRNPRTPAAHGTVPSPRPGVLRATTAVIAVLTALALASFPAREALYLAIARTTEGSPFGEAAGLVADKGLLLLVAAAGGTALHTWLRDRHAFRTLVCAGAGVVGAYLTSELVKILVTEQRPCRTLSLETVLTCPAPGDWSWPSNHSVIAAAFATACLLAVPRTAWAVVPVALMIGLSRVAAGVHYVHDVASGLALGALLVALLTLVLRPLAARLPYPLASSAAPAHRKG